MNDLVNLSFELILISAMTFVALRFLKPIAAIGDDDFSDD